MGTIDLDSLLKLALSPSHREMLEEIRRGRHEDSLRFGVHCSKKTYEEFKALAGDVSVSALFELWMRAVVAAEKKKDKKK